MTVVGEVPPVSALADVCALFGLDGWLTPPLVPFAGAAAPVAGRAVTVELARREGGSLTPLHELVSDDLGGAVVVIAGGRPIEGAVWGEIMSRAARSRGAVAVLVDGAVRDRPGCASEGLPVYASEERVVGPQGRADVVATGGPVTIGDVVVAPGDLVVVDAGGALRIPAAEEEPILAAARAYASAEEEVLAALARGEALLPGAYHHKASATAALREEVRHR